MSGRVDSRLAELGVELPEAAAPAANYVPRRHVGDLVWIAGQIPVRDGELVKGKVGRDLDAAAAKDVARLCAINILAQARAAAGGDLDRVRLVKLNGFVNCTPDFGDQSLVINGASDFAVEVLGEAGHHARSAVGVASLPFGVPVEIDAIIQILP